MAASAAYRYQEELSSLPLVDSVNILKSYMLWIELMEKHVEKAAYSKLPESEANLGNYIKLILDDVKAGKYGDAGIGSNNDGDNDEEDGVDWSVSVGYVSKKMNVAAMFAYVGDFEGALSQLKSLQGEDLAGRLNNLTGKRKDIVVLFCDSLAWTISQLKEGGSSNQGLFQEESSSQARKLNGKWEELVEGGGQQQMKAIRTFLKGCLGAALKVKEEATRNCWIEATKLDPQCYVWFHYAYRVIRRIRRASRKTNWLCPSEMEERLAGTAYYLCENDIVTVTDYASLLKDKLWMKDESDWESQKDAYLKCETLFQKALTLAEESGQKKRSQKISVYLAEFQTMGKGSKLNRDAGKRMLEKLAIEYPASSFVLHKVAKLYNFGIYKAGGGSRDLVDPVRALEYYKQALENSPMNYACLMDYLKLLQRRKEYEQMIRAMEKSMEHLKRDYQMAKLHVMKGYLTWVWNPMSLRDPKNAAIDSWLCVLKKFPNCDERDVFLHRPIYFHPEFINNVIKSDILPHLEDIKQTGYYEDEKLINTLIMTFSKLAKVGWGNGRKSQGELVECLNGLRISSQSRINAQHPVQGGGWNVMRGPFGNVGDNQENVGYRRKWRRSEADEDNDWRKKD